MKNRLFTLLTTFIVTGASVFGVLGSTSAFAHHPLGGTTPDSLTQGLLSGIFHPIIGLDHLAFIVAVGVVATLIGSRLLLPLAFVVATLAGTGFHLYSISFIGTEFFVALSLLVLGMTVAIAHRFSITIFALLFSFFGLFHGFAYGEAIFGAETTPLVAYLVGFGVVQYALAIASGTIVVSLLGKSDSWTSNLPARIAGAMVAGAGALLVGEHALIFLGLSS